MVVSGSDGATSRVFRVMLKAEGGEPLRGDGDCMLGARVPIDVKVDPDGQVHPDRGGMSVTPDDPARLPPHFRPVSLGGYGKLPVFGIGVARLGERLSYRPDPKKPARHGFVEPALTMPLATYRTALAATAPAWEEFP
jgi:hypothetical protein